MGVVNTHITCKSCGSNNLLPFYFLENVPVHSVLLMPTKERATTYPKGNIELVFCEDCGFIFNRRFDPTLHEYSSEYEETQAFSSTFNEFQTVLARNLIKKYNLGHKNILEIGCGKGEFLTMLCEMGDNQGIGFDPSYIEERNKSPLKYNIIFIKDFYSDKYAKYKSDFIVCKMTLEHIADTSEFISMIRRSLDDRRETVVFFQVPNVKYIVKDLAFWDIYYEHCSYFSAGSLSRLFKLCDFDVLDVYTDYKDQYLMIEAKPKNDKIFGNIPPEDDIDELRKGIENFVKQLESKLRFWKQKLLELKKQNKTVIVWGAGSKAVSFLSTLKITDEIYCGVDINPFKHETYLAGTGHKIVGPGYLSRLKPDVVIVMNPVYIDEIRNDLSKLNLHPELLSV
jgi:SAM-dependent methyltransferase